MSTSTTTFRMFATAGTVAFIAIVIAGGPVRAQRVSAGARRPSPIIPLAAGGNGDGNGTTITNFTATPGTISFNATSPGTNIPGSSAATVSYTVSSNSKGGTWTLSVGTTSTTFPGCTSVPVSAVKVWCTSATFSGSNNKGASAACGTTTPTQLPSTLPGLQVASGGEPQSQAAGYTVTLNYQIADSWKYLPNTCQLAVTYTVNAP